MALVWLDKYSVGHEQIDADHRRLFDITNRFCAAQSVDAARSALSELVNYANEHFRREEAVLLAYSRTLDGYGSHIAGHEDLQDKLRDLILSYSDLKRDQGRGSIVKDTAILLETWIYQHVAIEDMKLRRILGKPVDGG